MIVLVQMPFAAVERPSMALGLLKAELGAAGLDCRVLYPNIRWCERVGLETHEAILGSLVEDLVGEWVFAGAAFGATTIDEDYLRRVVRLSELARQPQGEQALRRARAQAGPFVDQVARQILDLEPRIVGCTSMFQQNCASLALLRRLKELRPELITVMGGANCEGPMGATLVRHFPWLDYVVSGEADKLAAPFFRGLLEGRPEFPHGVLTRQASYNGEIPRATFNAMDQTVIPDFDDYFAALRASVLDPLPTLLVETSRGCWWGQKHHCTFCGLNGSGMGYRSKSKERVLEELEHLADRYQISRFTVVDNILDLSHLKQVMPVLAERGGPVGLFYETKSNLRRDQLELLLAAGVRWIQPGIESLHDRILELMDKGSNAMMNVQLLRNCRELGIHVTWNFLVSLPGEKDEWYGEVAEWLPLLFHLQPPIGFSRIHYDRFSPYHNDPDRYGIRVQPARGYASVYPLAEEDLRQLAYFFEDQPEDEDREDRRLPTPGRQALYRHIKTWNQLFSASDPPRLSVSGRDVSDTRPGSPRSQYQLSERAAALLLECQTPRRALTDEPALRELLENRLLLHLGEHYLALATQGEPRPLPLEWEHPLGRPERPPQAPPYDKQRSRQPVRA